MDNSLRATKRNTGARRIDITLATAAGAPRAGLISVSDNGCGMNTRELNEWAVMNLSMALNSISSQSEHPDLAPL